MGNSLHGVAEIIFATLFGIAAIIKALRNPPPQKRKKRKRE